MSYTEVKTSEKEQTQSSIETDKIMADMMRMNLVEARIDGETIDVEVFEALAECNSHLLDKISFRLLESDMMQ
jgi:hypothetical protein